MSNRLTPARTAQFLYFGNPKAAVQWFIYSVDIQQYENAFGEQPLVKIPDASALKTHGSKEFAPDEALAPHLSLHG